MIIGSNSIQSNVFAELSPVKHLNFIIAHDSENRYFNCMKNPDIVSPVTNMSHNAVCFTFC